MPAYPASPQFSYPVVRRLEFQTRIVTGTNGTEQRWPLALGQESFTITYPNITLAERDSLLTAFVAAKGAYAQDLDFPFGSETFYNCYFDADSFQSVESTQGRCSVGVTLRQLPAAIDNDPYDADFPALATGHKMQLPYTLQAGFDTVVVKTEGGRFRYSNRAAALRTWSAGGSLLSNADAGAIFNLFKRTRGRWGLIHFTDPDSDVHYESCRFASDVLEWRYSGPDENAITVQIQEIPA
ncbi:MAG: hypothetical protein LLG20_26265 [Acidobacteriales bacterium]|nr:hypothetical protein [Terriglobales bacterium]